MQQSAPKCFRCVGKENYCIKYGKTKEGKQRYQCKTCNQTFIHEYYYKAYFQNINNWIKNLIKEGSGIRSIARLLSISTTTVLKRIKAIAATISQPIPAFDKEYEIDELCTYYKKKTKLLWIAYALRRDTKEVTAFTVGSRTANTL